ncbi:MAG: adenylyl-sulfate kinase [bacterium]
MTNPESKNITWSVAAVTHGERIARNGHRGAILWFTGLSASGKSTLASLVEKELFARGCNTYVLDGDNVRYGLNSDLGFSPEDRAENIRRIGEVANLMMDAGIISLTAFISPYRSDRRRCRDIAPDGHFIEIFCRCSLEECERRDPKGLYKKARKGEIPEFTGISAPYEEPENPEVVVETDRMSPPECVGQIIDHLEAAGFLRLNGDGVVERAANS